MSTIERTTQPDVEETLPPVMAGAAPERRPRTAGAEGRRPVLGRDETGVLLTDSVGIPVHAVLAPGRRLAPGTVLELLDAYAEHAILVTFANPATALLARRSPAFARDLRAFDLVLPDGIGMVLAIKWLHGLPARRISFDMTSLGPDVFEHAMRERWSIVLVGGGPGVAARAGKRVAGHYPGLRIAGTFEGFGDMEATLRMIVALEPRIIICGMGGVRQEAFLLDAVSQGWRGWGFTCGGFLDQLQSSMTYYPRWIDRANLRWAYRLAREPRRLWRRYVVEYSAFALMLCAERVRK